MYNNNNNNKYCHVKAYIVLISTHPRGQSGAERSNNRRDDDVGGCALATVARDGRLELQLSLFTGREEGKYNLS